jgi:tetratricopeptide (TPR) repeat protein
MASLSIRFALCFAASALALVALPSPDARGSESSPAASTEPTHLDGKLSSSPLEARLLADSADGRWDEHSLFIAAQIAGGTTDAELLAASLDYSALIHDLRLNLGPSLSGEDRAAAVLAFLHRRLLFGGYDLNATTLREAFASGRFNCVSATVLYNCLAAEAGLMIQPLRLPQHTCSLLRVGDRRIRVEATCSDWFEARHRPAAIHRSADTDDGIPVSEVALVAMIYYNRGVEALRHNQLEEAIRLNRLALSLDPENTQAKGNLLSAINKRALNLAAQKRFKAAIELVEHGLSIDPSHSPLRQNREFIEHAQQHTAKSR